MGNRDEPGQPRATRVGGRLVVLAWVVVGGWLVGSGTRAWGQAGVVNFRKPILAVETAGHHAPVRRLAWQDDATLFSAGEDKVVKQWDLAERRPTRTLRPMIWRGLAGSIYAMALSPRPDPSGQRWLAVAGYGVEISRADITVFRVPGPNPDGTGEVVARLMPRSPAQPIGHDNSITSLAISPDGRTLASASVDGTAILWDLPAAADPANPRPAIPPRVQLRGHLRGIRELAFFPDGRRIATVGEDGTLRIWEVATGRQLDQTPDGGPRPVINNALAISPDGATILVGRENGTLFAFSAANLAVARRWPTRPDQGAIEAIAYAPDGRHVVVSLLADKPERVGPRALRCDVEVRTAPAGAIVSTRRVAGLARACTVSPDGTRFAYSGQTSQAISVEPLLPGAAPAPVVELKGKGSTVYDLGFGPDDRVLGFTREVDPTRRPTLYEGFEPATRRATTVARDQLQGAVATWDGWAMRADLANFRLEAFQNNQLRWRADIDPDTERYWWSTTIIPPAAGHPRPTVAVGCETGVIVYDLQTGRRTRMYAGHASPVVSVAPSRDGRWLASSSLDQTVRLDSLDGCDVRPGLGATFAPGADGAWSVATVAPRGFAADMGLVPGDVVFRAMSRTRNKDRDPAGNLAFTNRTYQTPAEIAGFLQAGAAEVAPNDRIILEVRRKVPGAADATLAMPTTKRNDPFFALMQDTGREWVFWSPLGYYDTSVEGDARLLGWHTNPDFLQARSTDFVPVGAFPALLRPDVLQRLWTTRDLDVALQVPAANPAPLQPPADLVAAAPPPKITIAPVGAGLVRLTTGLLEASVPRPRVRLQLASAALGDRQIEFDGRPIRRRAGVGPGPEFAEELDLDLPPDRPARLLVTAWNQGQNARTEVVDLQYRPPAPVPAPPVAPAAPRLVVVAAGSDAFPAGHWPTIPFATAGGRAIGQFVADRVVTADGGRPRRDQAAPAPAPTAPALIEQLAGLDRMADQSEIHPGDVVVVVVAAHVVRLASAAGARVALADSTRDKPETSVAAGEISDRLGRLTDYGCRVVLFLDGVHDDELAAEVRSDLKGWLRDLQRNRRVVTFVAAKEGVGGSSISDQLGLFALGVTRSIEVARSTGIEVRPDRPLSFDEFRTALTRAVLDLSNRQQEVGGFLPPGVAPGAPFLLPLPPGS